MKTTQTSNWTRAFSALDLLIVIATIVVLVGVFLPPMMSKPKGSSQRIRCVNNLKQAGIGFRLWAIDAGEQYPAYNETNEVWQYFQTVGKEIGSPKVLLCPTDAERTSPALDFEENGSDLNFAHASRQNNALSYFYGSDSSETLPNMLLGGDRNISTNDSILTGMLKVSTNTSVKWTKDLHNENGNILLADGSAHQINATRLREQIRLSESTNEFQRLLIP